MKKRLHTIPIKNIKIKDCFWSRYTELVKKVIIPYQWAAINDQVEDAEPSHCLENFKIAAGEKKGKFHGVVFQDTDAAKWLEAVAFSLAQEPDDELERKADEVIDLIGRAQCQDGYINTYWTIKEQGRRFRNLTEGHELYTAGHLIEAAVAYYQTTGKRKFLDIMIKFADLICEVFGTEEGKNHGYPGHQEIELALVKLYFVTNERKYLDTAKYFIDARGQGENYFLKEIKHHDFKQIFPEFAGYLPIYSQSHLPVREQKTAEGHAVRATYMYCAMADLAYEYEDEELMQACRDLWDNMVYKRMFITGSIGSSGILERFTTDYDLPNDCNYSESCASIGLALFSLRMAQILRESKYVDIVELALYNTVLSGINLDGKGFFYVNPLEVWPDNCLERTSKEHVKPIRQKWFGVACCPPNIARTLASLGQYIYSADSESIFLNLFISNEADIMVGNQNVRVKIETKFPIENNITISVNGDGDREIYFGIRIPEYAHDFMICSQGNTINYEKEKGFALIRGRFEQSIFNVSFKSDARFVRANPQVRADIGKVAIMKGPLVYALEEIDNGSNLSAIYVDTKKDLTEEYDDALFGGTLVIKGSGKRVKQDKWKKNQLYGEGELEFEDIGIKAIPYAYWNNRGMNEMLVWVKELPKNNC